MFTELFFRIAICEIDLKIEYEDTWLNTYRNQRSPESSMLCVRQWSTKQEREFNISLQNSSHIFQRLVYFLKSTTRKHPGQMISTRNYLPLEQIKHYKIFLQFFLLFKTSAQEVATTSLFFNGFCWRTKNWNLNRKDDKHLLENVLFFIIFEAFRFSQIRRTTKLFLRTFFIL